MRIRIKCTFVLLAIAAVFALRAGAQNTKAPDTPRPEFAAGYTYVRSNAPPGGCTCINLNGANATFAWPVKTGGFALVGDFTISHAGNIGSSSYTLTMSTFTGGVRYLLPVHHRPVRPFGQVLLGAAHSSGTLVEGNNPASANAAAAFAANIGGGLDLKVDRRFAIRLIEADYLITTFDNGSNNHQNNIRIGAGVVFRF
jgi:outer membrane immunogenic protein